MRRLTDIREIYRRADLRVRMLLFGDGDTAGRLKGEESRRQATVDLRRMRDAFDQAVAEAERSDLPNDLRDRAVEERAKQPNPTADSAT